MNMAASGRFVQACRNSPRSKLNDPDRKTLRYRKPLLDPCTVEGHAITTRIVVFSGLWLALTGASTNAMYFGAPVALLAAWLSLALYPASKPGIRLWRATFYAPQLFLRGFWGGLDVARRAIDPRLPVRPGWARVPLTSALTEPNAVLGGIVSVLPGTLVAGECGGAMQVHVLDTAKFDPHSIVAEERRVLHLFGIRAAAQPTDGARA